MKLSHGHTVPSLSLNYSNRMRETFKREGCFFLWSISQKQKQKQNKTSTEAMPLKKLTTDFDIKKIQVLNPLRVRSNSHQPARGLLRSDDVKPGRNSEAEKI